MNARFVGGPLDDQTFDHNQLNALADIVPLSTESGHRQFLLMPDLDQCQRILRGEASKGESAGPSHPYEREFLADGGVVYRDASNGTFDEALRAQSRPLTPEDQEQKAMFGLYADQFAERLRQAELSGATEVSIVQIFEDQDGTTYKGDPSSVTPQTSVRFPGDVDGARRFAAAMHLDALIKNIDSLVRSAPTGFLTFPDRPGRKFRIVRFELKIEQP